MKLIKPKFEIIEQECTIPNKMDASMLTNTSYLLNGIYKQIELAGRTCYKSEDKITPDSAKEFVDRMIKSGHGAMLEHGTVYLMSEVGYFGSPLDQYRDNHYSKFKSINGKVYVTTNFRVLVENNWLDNLKYICEPTEYHEKRVTVKFICDRGVSHEFVRHRVFSFAQESTRYCNYSKDKFGNELTFIYPCWFNQYFEDNYSNLDISNWQIGLDIANSETNWLYAMLYSEKAYFASILNGMKPQQARAVLPNSLKTELIMTGFISDWEHFFDLRCAQSVHPQARELAIPLKEEFIKRNLIK